MIFARQINDTDFSNKCMNAMDATNSNKELKNNDDFKCKYPFQLFIVVVVFFLFYKSKDKYKHKHEQTKEMVPFHFQQNVRNFFLFVSGFKPMEMINSYISNIFFLF